MFHDCVNEIKAFTECESSRNRKWNALMSLPSAIVSEVEENSSLATQAVSVMATDTCTSNSEVNEYNTFLEKY